MLREGVKEPSGHCADFRKAGRKLPAACAIGGRTLRKGWSFLGTLRWRLEAVPGHGEFFREAGRKVPGVCGRKSGIWKKVICGRPIDRCAARRHWNVDCLGGAVTVTGGGYMAGWFWLLD